MKQHTNLTELTQFCKYCEEIRGMDCRLYEQLFQKKKKFYISSDKDSSCILYIILTQIDYLNNFDCSKANR